jgi:hypothetical protein
MLTFWRTPMRRSLSELLRSLSFLRCNDLRDSLGQLCGSQAPLEKAAASEDYEDGKRLAKAKDVVTTRFQSPTDIRRIPKCMGSQGLENWNA